MKWTIEFYRGVGEDIQHWPTGIKAKFTWIIIMIEKHGPEEIGMPHIKPLGKGLFEIRARGKEGIGRASFCILSSKQILILTAFIKKTQKTPKNEMDLAIKRLKELK